MSKRTYKREQTEVPREWSDLLNEHEHRLARVRMLWRRGGGRYRPLIPISTPLEEIDGDAFEDWEALELKETHFTWVEAVDEEPRERRLRLSRTLAELWDIAVGWTKAHGPTCDFQLSGWGEDDELLFEDGRRCNLIGFNDEGERLDADARPPSSHRSDLLYKNMIREERNAWARMDKAKDDFLGKLSEDRDKLFGTTQQASAAAPALIERVSEILQSAIAYQEQSVANLCDNESGQRELHARAFAEQEQTKRTENVLGFLKYAVDAAVANIGPLAARFLETRAYGVGGSLPQFECAQQAMSYIVLTVTETQLVSLFGANTEGAEDFVRLLAASAQLDNEQAALVQALASVMVLRSQRYSDVANPEQQIAGRFIIGRLALYRMQAFDDSAAE